MNPFLWLVRKTGAGVSIFFIAMLFFETPAMASENTSSWRASYDLVMMWVNFFILIILLYKVGKKPVVDFLSGSRDDIALEIGRLENQRLEIRETTEETLRNIESSKTHFKEVSERIIANGEKAKQSIIENAKNQGHMMLQNTQKKIESLLTSAKKDFRSELIDASMDLAMEKIATHVTPEDDQRLIEQYLLTPPKKQ
ncbi:MAG: ATP synthase F0 subunit B [Desulfobacteraceae bacterium]|nr:ATP synthase F0 subunit B [Desulfobacteraceae bacterium]